MYESTIKPEMEQVSQQNESHSLEMSINAKVFKGLVDVLSTIVDEVELRYDNEGLTVKTVDPAHVCLLEMTVPAKAFSIWSMTEGYKDNHIRIGLDLNDMKHILKAVKKDDMLNMSFTEKNINISVGNVVATIPNKDCTNMSDPKIPAFNLPGRYNIEVQEMYEAMRQCGNVSSEVTITLHQEDIIFQAVNKDAGLNTKLTFPNAEPVDYVQTKYSIEYLKPHYAALKRIDKTGFIMVSMGTDYPMNSEALLNDDIRIKFLLAPRIDTD